MPRYSTVLPGEIHFSPWPMKLALESKPWIKISRLEASRQLKTSWILTKQRTRKMPVFTQMQMTVPNTRSSQGQHALHQIEAKALSSKNRFRKTSQTANRKKLNPPWLLLIYDRVRPIHWIRRNPGHVDLCVGPKNGKNQATIRVMPAFTKKVQYPPWQPCYYFSTSTSFLRIMTRSWIRIISPEVHFATLQRWPLAELPNFSESQHCEIEQRHRCEAQQKKPRKTKTETRAPCKTRHERSTLKKPTSRNQSGYSPPGRPDQASIRQIVTRSGRVSKAIKKAVNTRHLWCLYRGSN